MLSSNLSNADAKKVQKSFPAPVANSSRMACNVVFILLASFRAPQANFLVMVLSMAFCLRFARSFSAFLSCRSSMAVRGSFFNLVFVGVSASSSMPKSNSVTCVLRERVSGFSAAGGGVAALGGGGVLGLGAAFSSGFFRNFSSVRSLPNSPMTVVILASGSISEDSITFNLAKASSADSCSAMPWSGFFGGDFAPFLAFFSGLLSPSATRFSTFSSDPTAFTPCVKFFVNPMFVWYRALTVGFLWCIARRPAASMVGRSSSPSSSISCGFGGGVGGFGGVSRRRGGVGVLRIR
mmetsp:Transcript_27400/g.43664  ORF Transcript_27400/g.43664 Transcript_27400/m.43664 type:complete len:294 (-) Transcript_27400:57-938(-)